MDYCLFYIWFETGWLSSELRLAPNLEFVEPWSKECQLVQL